MNFCNSVGNANRCECVTASENVFAYFFNGAGNINRSQRASAKSIPADVLPKILVAGDNAGTLTKAGSEMIDGLLPEGIPFAPPEGDGGTGMIATNAVAPRTGNVSAGTSIFAMVVTEKPLENVYAVYF